MQIDGDLNESFIEAERNIFDNAVEEELEKRAAMNLLEDEERTMFERGCGCELKCDKKLDSSVIMDSRLSCLDFNEHCNYHINHQHLLLLGAFNALTHTADVTEKYGHKGKSRKKSYTNFEFRGHAVCRNFFQFVNGIGVKKLKNVKRNFLKDGVYPHKHGKSGQPVIPRATSTDQKKAVVSFIQNFSQQNSLVMPGRMPNYHLNTDLHILPCSMNKMYVFREYLKCAPDEEKVSQSEWYRLWEQYLQKHCSSTPTNRSVQCLPE